MISTFGRLLAACLVVLLASACAGEGEAPDAGLDAAAVRYSTLQDDLIEVNNAQAATVGLLVPALDALATVDATVPLLVDGDTIDDGLARVPAARVAIDLVDLAPTRPSLVEVARAVDDARLSLRRAADVFTEEVDLAYLEATDVVLEALRELSAAQDALAQVVERHLIVYDEFVAVAEDFAARRNRFRSKDEAADAFSVEARSMIRDIATAQADVATFLAERDAAAKAVALAQAAADAAFEARADQ